MAAWIIHTVRSRLKEHNQNWICTICGATGTGKSYSALRLAETIDPSFTIDRLVFKAENFMQLLNSGVLRKGNVIIFDEAGTGIPARDWYTICNKAINYVFQTFRRENLAVILTTPSLSFLDVQTRILAHAYIEALRVDIRNKRVRVKAMFCEFDPKTGKTYRKYYRRGRGKVNKLWIGKPSEGLVKEYEAKKKLFSGKLYKGTMKDIAPLVTGKMSPQEIAEKILEDPKIFLKLYRGDYIIDAQMICVKFPVGGGIAKRAKRIVELALREKNII